MANDNRPRYARIGFVVLLGALATAGALVYLGGFERLSIYKWWKELPIVKKFPILE